MKKYEKPEAEKVEFSYDEQVVASSLKCFTYSIYPNGCPEESNTDVV